MELVPRRTTRATLVLLLVLVAAFGIVPQTQAAHGPRTLEVLNEVTSVSVGTVVLLTAQLSSAPATGTAINIDFEVISGVNNPDGNSPSTPDATCTILPTQTTCVAAPSFSSSVSGFQLVVGWIDHSNGNTIVERDAGETRYSGAYVIDDSVPPSTGDCTPMDPSTQDGSCPETGPGEPGIAPEPDITDVVRINYATAPTKLNCNPESSERQPAGTGSAQPLNCTAKDANNNGVGGVLIDAENEDGANDGDDGHESPADFNNLCTTNADGECTGSVTPAAEGQEGEAFFCTWADLDNNTTVGSDIDDGGGCATEAHGDPENDNLTDKVLVTYSDEATVPAADHLHLWVAGTENPNCDSGSATAVSGATPTTIKLTTCVHDSSHQGISGVEVDFDETGPATPDDSTKLTDAQGKATQTFTSFAPGISSVTTCTCDETSGVVTIHWKGNWDSPSDTLEPDASSWQPGRLDVFGTDPGDAHLQHKWFTGSWTPFENLGGVIVGGPTAVSWGPNRIDVFVRGTDDALWHRWWDGASWKGWESLGGVLASSPDVASWGPNRLDVFVRGTDDKLHHKWWDGTSWSGWEALGGTLVGDPGAVSWGHNRIDVFVRGTDDKLYHRWWDGASWRGFESLGGSLDDDPDASSWGTNRIDVFSVNSSGQLIQLWWDGVSWKGFKNLGVPKGGVTIEAQPGPVSWGFNRIDVFVEGSDGTLYHRWWDGKSW